LTTLLELEGISKTFPGVRALADVHLSIERGEIHALLGENGAGKSTLVNIIGGTLRADDGTISISGRILQPRSARDSIRDGIAVIHQELSVVPALSVTENISLGRLPGYRTGLLVDWTAARARAVVMLERLGADIDPDVDAMSLSTGAQQQVEIARALASEPLLLVMDEPTSALSEHETSMLLATVRKLAESGLTVIYITHRLEEIRRIANRLTVLRDGRVTLTAETSNVSRSAIVEAMIGRSLAVSGSSHPSSSRKPVLQLDGLATAKLGAIDLTLHEGEILGVAGLLGSGRTSFMRAIYGLDRRLGGRMLIDGRPVRISSPLDATRHRVFLVPEDRKAQGLVLTMSVLDNMTLPLLGRLSRWGFLDRKRQKSIAKTFIDRLHIKTSGPYQRVGLLSGGNQQKVVLARWLSLKPRVILLDQPTRGLDIGAKEEVYELIRELGDSGVGVIFVATEIPELLRIADRIVVLHGGSVVTDIPGHGATEHDIFLAAVGEAS
jgi:ribose transport system ATP-binding protein